MIDHDDDRDHSEDGDGENDGDVDVDLGAGEMHAAALGEGVAEVARRATDPVLRQVSLIIIIVIIMMRTMITKPDLNSLSLGVRVVFLFPASKVRAGDSLVLMIMRSSPVILMAMTMMVMIMMMQV